MPVSDLLNAMTELTKPTDQSRYYKEASKMMLGTALGGVLARALGAPDYFSAGMVEGGLRAGQGFLQNMIEQDRQWQNIRNRLATELVIWGLKEEAKRTDDLLKRKQLSDYANVLKQLYPAHTDKDGSFDIAGFARDASIAALQLGVDPTLSKEIQQSFINAQTAIHNIDKAKAQADMFREHAKLFKAQAESTGKGEPEKPPTPSQIRAKILQKYLNDPNSLTEQERRILGLDKDPYLTKAIQLVEADLKLSLLPIEEKLKKIKAVAEDLKRLARGSTTPKPKPMDDLDRQILKKLEAFEGVH